MASAYLNLRINIFGPPKLIWEWLVNLKLVFLFGKGTKMIPKIQVLAPLLSLLSAFTIPRLVLTNFWSWMFLNFPWSNVKAWELEVLIGESKTIEVNGFIVRTSSVLLRGWRPFSLQVLIITNLKNVLCPFFNQTDSFKHTLKHLL